MQAKPQKIYYGRSNSITHLRFQRFTNLEMESMIYTGYVAGHSGNSYEFTGDLGLVQKQPLWSRHHDSRFNKDVIPRDSLNAKDYAIAKIIRNYAARNGNSCKTVISSY